MNDVIAIDGTRFSDDGWIESGIAAAAVEDRGALRTALAYLYKDDGPRNLPRDRLLKAQPYLEVAERLVARWLYTRTNGSERKNYGGSAYGDAAIRAARGSRYRCGACGFADVRALHLDHVNGRVAGTPFACLCANCHAIKTRTGETLERESPASDSSGAADGTLGLEEDDNR